ncbi:hypothetical protein V8E52_000675 [Russula decolorans]
MSIPDETVDLSWDTIVLMVSQGSFWEEDVASAFEVLVRIRIVISHMRRHSRAPIRMEDLQPKRGAVCAQTNRKRHSSHLGPQSALKTKPYHPSNCEEASWREKSGLFMAAITNSEVSNPSTNHPSALNPGQSGRQVLGRVTSIQSDLLLPISSPFARRRPQGVACGVTHFLTETLYPTGMPSTCKLSPRWVPVLGMSDILLVPHPEGRGICSVIGKRNDQRIPITSTGKKLRRDYLTARQDLGQPQGLLEYIIMHQDEAILLVIFNAANFSGWYVVLLTVEASEGKTLAGRTDMNVRISRFTASSEKRTIQVGRVLVEDAELRLFIIHTTLFPHRDAELHIMSYRSGSMITKLTFPGPDFITGTRGGAMKDPVNDQTKRRNLFELPSGESGLCGDGDDIHQNVGPSLE